MRRRMTAAQQEAVEALKGYNDPFGDELTPYEQRAIEQLARYADSRLADGTTREELAEEFADEFNWTDDRTAQFIVAVDTLVAESTIWSGESIARMVTLANNPDPSSATSLATRPSRLVAKLIDWILFSSGVIFLALLSDPGFQSTLSGNSLDDLLFLDALWMFGIVTVQVVMLTLRGQTIGKRIVGIRIVSIKTGQNAGFVRNVAMRAWLNTLLWLVPLYWIVDVLFIFKEDRRCIHDRLAGTRVVK